jgi:UDP-glucose 4-epimerase
MKDNSEFSAFNLGNGSGFSVLDVIGSCEHAVKKTIPYDLDMRRAGDPPMLVADSSAATYELSWGPKFGSLDALIKSAWKWHKSLGI